jgi:ParB-like chromosome segregation protein Spo0J
VTDSLPISDIVIGERVRKDMGDLAGLAESIKRHGLLHPVVVKKDNALISGHRRIEAARLLGWQEIPVTIIEVEDLLSAERDENEVRKDFTPTEAVEIGRLIEERERPLVEARRRQKISATMRGEMIVKNRDLEGMTVGATAKAVGMSGTSYFKAKEVVAAAEADPDKFGDLPAKMDETGNVYGTHRELQQRGGLKKNGKRRGVRNDKTAAYDPKSKGQIQRAEAQKNRMVSSLSIVTGHCRGLEELDVLMALSVCTKQEIKTWAKKSRDLSVAFRDFARKLEKGIK